MRKGAIPSRFPNLPTYLSKPSAAPRPTTTATSTSRLEREERRLQQDIQNFFKEDAVRNLDEIYKKRKSITLPGKTELFWHQEELIFVCLSFKNESVPEVEFSLKIDKNMIVYMSANGVTVPCEEVQHLLTARKVCALSAISNILAYLQAKSRKDETKLARKFIQNCVTDLEEISLGEEHLDQKLTFLCEQLQLLTVPKNARKYSPDLLSAALLWKTTSPALYKQLLAEGHLTLPSLSHLQRLSKAFTTDSGMSSSALSYLKLRIQGLSEREKLVVLLIDEIYSAQRIEYSGGKVFGMEGGSACKTVLSFMVKSVAGKYSDVVALYPISRLDHKNLRDMFDKVILSLSDVGMKVVCVSVDNATPNRKFLQELCSGSLKTNIPHPVLKEEELFLLFDSVHNFKNIYNNFQNKKVFVAPGFEDSSAKLSADFKHLEQLYDYELGKPAKMAHKLSEKALHPTALEKTNVKLADSVFHDSTIAALDYYAEEKNADWAETAKFLKLIRHWWNTVNVKSPSHGKHKRDSRLLPITSTSLENDTFLVDFSRWLTTWQEKSKEKNSEMKGLTAETFLATIQTSSSLPKIAKYLLDKKGLSYVLLGQLQSDPIEKRFGWYRQLAGGNYFISVRQIFEAEKAIRLKSLLKFSKMPLGILKESLEQEEDDEESSQAQFLLLALLDKDELVLNCENDEDKRIMFYIAGYLARSLSKKTTCKECVALIKEDKGMTQLRVEEEDNAGDRSLDAAKFLEQINRGGLSYPSDLLYIISLHVWTFYSEVESKKEALEFLLQASQPRRIFVSSFLSLWKNVDETRSISDVKCLSGHEFQAHLSPIVNKLFNLFTKNLCSDMNSNIRVDSKRKRENNTSSRKAKKLQSNAS